MSSIEVKAWKCENCGKAFLVKEFADKCCDDIKKPKINNCRVCGCEVNPPWMICRECREKERFEKAQKVKYSEYKTQWLWDESKQEYFSDKEALQDRYDDDAFDEQGDNTVAQYPVWCYGCIEIPFRVNIDTAVERAGEDMYEEFDASKEIVELKELTDFVEVWNKKQTARAFVVDYKKVVLLNE